MSVRKLPPDPRELHKRTTAIKALKFVYPDIRVEEVQMTAELAAWSFLLARALDATSRITYGAFRFYEEVATGGLARNLRWRDIPEAVVEGVKAALEDSDEYRWNPLARAAISYQFPQRLIQKHIADPQTYPLVGIRIGNTTLDRIVYKL